jgi:hypothetical protein
MLFCEEIKFHEAARRITLVGTFTEICTNCATHEKRFDVYLLFSSAIQTKEPYEIHVIAPNGEIVAKATAA